MGVFFVVNQLKYCSQTTLLARYLIFNITVTNNKCPITYTKRRRYKVYIRKLNKHSLQKS